MFLLASKNSSERGAYAVENQNGENVLFFFEEEDRALSVIEIEEALAIRTCKMYNYRYAVIKPEDIVIPPIDDNVSED